ncbi:LGFP repeat-containing protein [Enemella evansiae]|uniref:LGFP repeat-containing protein n=1 Tax=Enemella evansiae TaxID=2016499 RepID=UPI001552370B|nr:hypothetical protein [Enemella evansiae]
MKIGDFDLLARKMALHRVYGNYVQYDIELEVELVRASSPESTPMNVELSAGDRNSQLIDTLGVGNAGSVATNVWRGYWTVSHTAPPGDISFYSPWVKLIPTRPEWVRGQNTSGLEMNDGKVRCDNAVPGALPGCVIWGNTATYSFNRDDFPEYAAQVEAARQSGIPEVLTRLTDPARVKANGNAACPRSIPRDGLDCDEYPFRSSYQGAAENPGPARSFPWCGLTDSVRTGSSGFSRCLINSAQNQLGGSWLNAYLYVGERVVDKEPFVVRFYGGPPIYGAIRSKYDSFGGLRSRLAFPLAGEFCGLQGGGCGQRFKGGLIYWSPASGAHPVYGAIGERYRELGYERGKLGYPTSDEFCGLKDGGCAQRFQGGLLYWSPATGAQPVWGAILDAYGQVSWENSTLGYPTGEEFCGLKDGGCAQRFQGGMIYWSPGTGSWPVWGRILDYYAANRWESGRFGYPTSGESCTNGPGSRTCTQNFQWGPIIWDSVTGTRG